MKALKPNKINFAARLSDITEKNEKTAKSRRAYLPAALAVLAVALPTLYYAGWTRLVLDPGLLRIAQFINSEESQDAYSSSIAKDIERQLLITKRANFRRAFENIGSYPEMNNEAYGVVSQRAGDSVSIESMSFDRATGLLSVGCRAAYAINASDYAARLRSSGFFSSVDYFGYEGDVYGEAYSYKFTVILVIPPDGGDAS